MRNCGGVPRGREGGGCCADAGAVLPRTADAPIHAAGGRLRAVHRVASDAPMDLLNICVTPPPRGGWVWAWEKVPHTGGVTERIHGHTFAQPAENAPVLIKGVLWL